MIEMRIVLSWARHFSMGMSLEGRLPVFLLIACSGDHLLCYPATEAAATLATLTFFVGMDVPD